MNTFEISIRRRMQAPWPVVAEHATPGTALPIQADGILTLDLHAVSTAAAGDDGVLLGQALFRDRILRAFDAARTASSEALHVLLYLEPEELRGLRWERLCAPLDADRWSPLALEQRTPFSIYLPSVTDRRFPVIGRRDLRALVLAASPRDADRWGLAAFDVPRAVAGVRQSLSPIPCDVLADLPDAAGAPTLDALCRQITSGQYPLLHLVCHGRFVEGTEKQAADNVLYFSAADGTVDAVSATRFIERLSRLQATRGLPHCVFLSSCESAHPSAERALGGLAQRLVRELGTPAVVAMTAPISVDTAAALASVFYQRLREHGFVDRALTEAYAGLAERPDIRVPVPALYTRLAGQPLFSLATPTALKPAEVVHGLERLEHFLADPAAPRAPQILTSPDYTKCSARLRGLAGQEEKQLSETAREERGQALAQVSRLCLECLDIRFEALANDEPPPAYRAVCPFPGLEAFKPTDRQHFFGRDQWVAELQKCLASHPFLAVLGPSGSGKSSVVLAGLIPALQDADPNLKCADLTPGETPLAALDKALAGVTGSQAVLVVDQFEELFTHGADKATRQEFVDRLLKQAEARPVVITMRADFWGDCAPYDELREQMLRHQVLIPPMKLEELRVAMQKQAESAELRFETGLVGTILDDVQDQPGAMPLLQHALRELWERRHGRWLKHEEYQALGRVQGAIGRTADSVYKSLPSDEQRDRMRDVFLGLTRVDDRSAPGEARRDTRRRVRLVELLPADGDSTASAAAARGLEEVRILIQRLADKRLLVTSPSKEEDPWQDAVEVAHEALIRHWPRLVAWIDENRADLRCRQEIGESAQQWEDAARNDSYLEHRGPRLVAAEALRANQRVRLNRLQRDYVEACVALREREQRERERRRRWVTLGLSIGLAVTLILSIVAVVQWRIAVDARKDADDKAAAEAVARKEAERQAYISAVSLADQSRKDEHTTDQLRYLDKCRPDAGEADLRDFEWYHLWACARSPQIVLAKHSDAVSQLAYSSAEDLLVSGGGPADGLVRMWRASDRRLVFEFPARHAKGVTALAFSADGQYLATGAGDGIVRIWGASPTWGPQRHERRFDGPIECLAFARETPEILGVATGIAKVGGNRLDIWAWRPAGADTAASTEGPGRVLGSFPVAAVKALLVNSVGTQVTGIAFADGGISAFATASGRLEPGPPIDGGNRQISAAWVSPQGNLGAFCRDSDIQPVELQHQDGGTRPAGRGNPLDLGRGPVRSLDVSVDGEHFLAVVGSQAIRTNRESGKPLRWIGPNSPGQPTALEQIPVTAACFASSDAKRLAWGTNTGQVILETPDAKPAILDIESYEPKPKIVDATWSSAGTRILVQGRLDVTGNTPFGGTIERQITQVYDIRNYDPQQKRPIWSYSPEPQDQVRHQTVAFAEGLFAGIYRSESGGSCELFDLTGSEPKHTFPLAGDVRQMRLTADRERLVTEEGMASDRRLKIRALPGGKVEKEIPYPSTGECVLVMALARDGKYLITACNKDIRIWDMVTGVETDRFESQGVVRRLDAADQRLLVGGDGSYEVWGLPRQGEPISSGKYPDYLPWPKVAIHPDGRRVALAVMPRKIRLVDAQGDEVVSLEGRDAQVRKLAFSPDGESLLAIYEDNVVRVWRAPRETE